MPTCQVIQGKHWNCTSVYTGKHVRETVKAAFDLFQLSRKRNTVDEVEDDQTVSKHSRQAETNRNKGNSIELEVSNIVEVNANEGQEMNIIFKFISSHHKLVILKLDGLFEKPWWCYQRRKREEYWRDFIWK